jgi:pimeloyl-ACP methyl ester carboxylesterase
MQGMRGTRRSRIPGAIAAAVLAGCGSSNECRLPAYADPTAHGSSFVTLSGGVRLHYLDFGGSGETLLFLAGAGDSAHVFDDFAPRFVADFRVVALTRRGFGESDHPSGGYDTATLADDVAQFIATMGVGPVALVGHSIAGAEMTRLTVDRPDLVRKLVYLDAGYDWAASAANPNPAPAPNPPNPSAIQLASPEAFAAYLAWTNGVPGFPLGDVRATSAFDCSGKYVGSASSASITAALGAGAAAQHPDYARVAVPVLAIFTVPESASDVFPWLTADSPQASAAAAYFPGARAQLAEGRTAFAAALPGATVIEMAKTPHFLFLAAPDSIASAMHAFLTGG